MKNKYYLHMKTIPLFFVSLFLMMGCSSAQLVPLETMTVKYYASTRGGMFNVMVENKKMMVQKDRNGKPFEVSLSSKDLKDLAVLFQTIDLEKISTMKAPTQMSHYDGAMAAYFEVIKDGKTYTSAGFDHGHPPAEVKIFIDKLIEIAKNEK